MKTIMWVGAAVAAVLASAVAGYRAGSGAWPLPVAVWEHAPPKQVTSGTSPQRTILYWQDPDGKPDFSPGAKKTADGRDYVPVYEDQEADFKEAKPPAPAEKAGKRILYYRNPMGLADTSPVPKKDWMGMDYIPVYDGEQDGGNTVKVSPGRLQRTGVKTQLVGKLPIKETIKAPGVVAFDETRLSVVAMRFDGFINKVMPVTSGTHVKKGQPVMSVFGQELLKAGGQLVVEEVTGWKGPESDEVGTAPVRRDPRARVVGARRLLENLQVPNEVIEEIKRSRRVPDAVTWTAPQDGIVTERNAVDGQAFKAGDVLFRLADHSVIWVMADIPEGDVGSVRPDQAVTVRSKAYPGRVFNGKVGVLYPHLMKETRSARVRIELPNHDLALLPDMYTDVEIATGSDKPVVAVLTSSVIDSGSRQVVIVDLGDGRFAPRDVKLGRRGGDYVEVVDGVNDGDSVVVDGNFLIDAESNLQGALRALTAPSAKEAK
ncbi:MAG: efflux RND transporter periplasmic adaptor subunit [Hyphomicrobiaceae bacterium]